MATPLPLARPGRMTVPTRREPPRRPTGTMGPGLRRIAVRALKRLLPAAAILLLAAIALWPQIRGGDDTRRLTFRRGVDSAADSLRMRDARFQGIDERGRPYTVTANEAAQVTGVDEVNLVEPKADITLEDGAWVFLESARGLYRRADSKLDLSGGVVLNHDAGYEARSEIARIDLKTQTATGDQPVEAQGPFGTLSGTGFVATQGGKVIVVTGPATLWLAGEQNSGDQP